MAEPTLQDVFGANAIQDEFTLTITKADLTGLTATANNTAESLLVGLLLKARSYLNQTNFDTNIDQSVLIESGLSSFLSRGVDNTTYRTDSMTVSLAKVDTAGILSPDDY
ncbi:hypothetical protein IQ247_13730 [Plectonema cf. radiosum LEGE 06105]|uniref:Uncharacterized protein n=1 Tax=Plectonema cf. radiosum LEGE 06105 TaxID=945769 RepID=A0A8J7K268_9CYAN|nr:hypothetical protein [Plectonema radiosum]MBE9213712.1 hypothetical protein [Plectonema cf. radiosum LEGE 06105]